ncbi:MAG TPA: cyclase family protein [Nocardioidaceae bacterium]|nr:cyclase family protein [Nocardioidaceae bacterium]
MSTTDTGDRRVQFDFEIDFANGGGIQGQGFRLDIDGDNISDAALADYIVRDLRLLMVSEARIRNKVVFHERHKRAPAQPTIIGSGAERRHIDLSHTVEDGMTTYPGLPAPVIGDFMSREDSRDHYAPGTELQIGSIQLCANTGTYVDSPFHRYADGTDLAGLPLDRLADLDAVVVNVTGNQGRSVIRQQLLPYEFKGRAVLVHTGWDRHWGTEAYFQQHPFLAADAATLLVESGAALVGIDSLNIDDNSTGERPVHTTLLEAGIPICEHLTNLDQLPALGCRFSAVPVKVRGMGSFPVRAYASVR